MPTPNRVVRAADLKIQRNGGPVCGGAHFNLTKPSNDVQVVNVKKNGFNPKILSKNTLSQRAPTGAAVATKHLPVVVPVARVMPRIMAGTNAIPIPTIKSKKSIADQERGASRLGSRSSSLGADERLDRDNEDILGRHEHVSLLQPFKAASEGGEENQGGCEDKASFLSSIFRIGPGAGAIGCLAGGSNDTVVAPTDGVQTNATRGGAVTPVVVVGRHKKIQQKQIQNRLVFPGLSIEMKKIIVEVENGFNNSKIGIGRHATTDEVESTGAVAMQQRVKKKEYGHTGPEYSHSQIICVVIAAIALLLTLIYAESEECIDRTTNEKEIQKGERQQNKRQLLNKRGRARVGSRVARLSAKRKIAHGKAFRRPIMFLVLMFCLQLGDAFASSIEEPSSSSSAIARSSTDVARNDVPTIEDENGGDDAMGRVSSAAGGAAVVVASTNAALTSRNVFDGVDGAATTTMEMCQKQTVQLQKQHQQQTERLKHEKAQLRADRDHWRTHAIENGHIEPPISVDESTTALVEPTPMPLPVAPPEVNTQTIHRISPTDITTVKGIDTTPSMTTNTAVGVHRAVGLLLQQLQVALLLSPNVHHSKSVENIFLAANVLAQCRTTITSREKSHQVQSKLNVVEGPKSATAASSSSSGGELLCRQLIQLQKEVVQVMAREQVSKEERVVKVRVVMKKVAEVLNTYVVQNPLAMRNNELTMPALGMKLKGGGRRGVVVGGVRRRLLPACPTIYTYTYEPATGAGEYVYTPASLAATDGWNVWSASCVMGSQYSFEEVTVKIKKSSSMSGELIIEMNNNHFAVSSSSVLELEDVTLTGGSAAVSFFVLCIVVNTCIHSLTAAVVYIIV